jgi:hypothetical protein
MRFTLLSFRGKSKDSDVPKEDAADIAGMEEKVAEATVDADEQMLEQADCGSLFQLFPNKELLDEKENIWLYCGVECSVSVCERSDIML